MWSRAVAGVLRRTRFGSGRVGVLVSEVAEHIPPTEQPRDESSQGVVEGEQPAGRPVGVTILAILSLIQFHSRPGHLVIFSGSVSGLLGFGICTYLTWLRFSTESESIEHRYPLLGLGILLLIVRFQLVATGFLGEWMAYRTRGREPGYRVRWERGFEDTGSENDGA